MTESTQSRDYARFDALADEFVARYRQGERPAIQEYVDRFPEMAAEILELFPALVEVEQAENVLSDVSRELSSGAGPRLTQLGDYRILREVGRGGMGVVYEAEQLSLGRRVALKVLHEPRIGDLSHRRRFEREARAAARLHHTNIVPVFGVGEHEGTAYYVMQFIQGLGLDQVLEELKSPRSHEPPNAETLPTGNHIPPRSHATAVDIARSLMTGQFERSLIMEPSTDPTLGVTGSSADSGLMTLAETRGDSNLGSNSGTSHPYSSLSILALDRTSDGHSPRKKHAYWHSVARIGAQVADGLTYAHQQGVLHRDIKPSNLLLDTQGTVWVADFGLAKADDQQNLTHTGDILGTLRYMPPEAFEGKSGARGDIYALGMTIYELLALRPAFDEKDRARLIKQVTSESPPRLRKLNPEIPRDLETIVGKAIDKEPRDRFASADQMAEELRRYCNGLPIRSRRVPAHERITRWCRRNPMVAGLTALAALLMMTVAIVATVSAVRLKGQRDATAKNLRLANSNLIQAYTNEARAERRSRQAGHRFGTLAAIEKAMALAPKVGLSSEDRLALRNQAIAALALPDFRRGRSIPITVPLIRGFTIDADWQRYAVQEDDETIRIRRLSDDQELMSLPGLPLLDSHRLMRFSPDGRYLVVAPMSAEQPLRVFDLATGVLLLEEPSYYASNTRAWDFHPKCCEIAVARRDRTVAIYSLPEGTLDRQLDFNAANANNIHNLLYDPLGARIALSYQGPDGVAILDAATGQRLADRKIASYFFHIAWNPRRPDQLAIPIVNSHIEVWNVTTDRVMARCAPIGDGIIVAFHPSGDWLWSRGWNGQLRLWDARTGELALEYTTSSWHPEFYVEGGGQRIGVETDHNSVRPIEFAGGDIHGRLLSESYSTADTYGPIAADPTSRHFVTVGSGGTVVWDVASCTQRGVVPVGSESWRVRIDRDGSILTDLPYVIRWPMTAKTDGSTLVGPPHLLCWFGTRDGFEIALTGRRAVLAAYDHGALVVDLDQPTRRRFLGPQQDVLGVAITPDGKYVATATHARRGSLKLWDSETGVGQRTTGLAEKTGDNASRISPDGKWLVVGEDGLVFYDTRTWTRSHRVLSGYYAGHAFSPDSRIFACEDGTGAILLAESATGRELARLEQTDSVRSGWIDFTPDGSKLLVTWHDKPYISIWDLAELRLRLAEMGLDWDAPPIEPTTPPLGKLAPIPPPFIVDKGELEDWTKTLGSGTLEQQLAICERRLRKYPDDADIRRFRSRLFANAGRAAEALTDIEIALESYPDDPGFLSTRAMVLVRLNRQAEAARDFERALALTPQVANELNTQAWLAVTGPESTRNVEWGLALARKAVAAKPGDAIFINTLGVALYREGKYDEAVTTLESNVPNNAEFAGFDQVFLAMSYHRLGRSEDARQALKAALDWRSKQESLSASYDAEFQAFRAEAEALLESEPTVQNHKP